MIDKINTLINNWLNGNLPSPPSEIRLGIWGTVGSGKTIFLAKLYEALLESPDWVVNADKKAREFVEEHLKDMDNTNKEGLLPLPTDLYHELEIFRYTLVPQSSRISSSKIVLNFIDAAGEFYENRCRANTTIVKKKERYVNSDQEIIEETYKDIVEYLMSCDGIIILLDPKRSSQAGGESYRTLLFDLFNEFKERSRYLNLDLDRLEQYMAFCVTKVDDDDDLWCKGQNPEKLAQEVMGQKMWKFLTNNFCWVELDKEKRNQPHRKNRCEFFAVSAIGRYQAENGNWCKALKEPERENPDCQEENNDYPQYDKGYDPDSIADQKIPDNSPLPQGFGLNINQSNNSNLQRSAMTIKKGEECKSINLIEPIEWLIQSILYYPPKTIKSGSEAQNTQVIH